MTPTEILAAIDADRLAVTAAEWAANSGGEFTQWGCCPECGRADWKGHKDDCPFPGILIRHDAMRAEVCKLIDREAGLRQTLSILQTGADGKRYAYVKSVGGSMVNVESALQEGADEI